MKNTVIALALTGLVATPMAYAGESFPIEFTYDRAELQSEDGASAVYDRIRNEVADACEFTNGRRGVSAMNIEKKCIEQAVEATVQQINAKSLHAVHEEQVSSQIG